MSWNITTMTLRLAPASTIRPQRKHRRQVEHGKKEQARKRNSAYYWRAADAKKASQN